MLHRASSGASARKFENRTGHTSERKNKFRRHPRFPGARKWKRNSVLSGEVNVNQRQDGNGTTGTTPTSLSQVSRGCNGTVKVFATFVCLFVTSGNPDFRCSN